MKDRRGPAAVAVAVAAVLAIASVWSHRKTPEGCLCPPGSWEVIFGGRCWCLLGPQPCPAPKPEAEPKA